MNTQHHLQAIDDGAPSELERMIADSVEGLFAERVSPALLVRFDKGAYAQDLWQSVIDLGLPGALVAESAGGSGATWRDASPVLRAIGYWQAPLPLAETMLASLLLSRAGIEIPEGPISLIQIGRQGDAHFNHDEWLRLNGRALNVPWARHCRWAVIADAEQRIALVDLHQACIQSQEHTNLASEPRDTLTFHQTRVLAHGTLQLADVREPVWLLGALARSCMLVGTLEAALDKAVAYANERVQFGKAIGKFQAIQHQLAQIAGAISAARMSMQTALDSVTQASQAQPGSSSSVAFDIAVAKVCAGEAATQTAAVVHQVMGAIGFTHEHTLQFATRRLWSWRDEFGSDAQWADVLGQAAIAAGSQGFWPGLTARSL